MSVLRLIFSTLVAFWLLPVVPVLSWWLAGTDGWFAALLIASLMYLVTGVLIGLPLLLYDFLHYFFKVRSADRSSEQ